MRAAGLEIVEKIMDTQAVLIKSKKALHPDLIATITRRIEGVCVFGRGVGGWVRLFVCVRTCVCFTLRLLVS